MKKEEKELIYTLLKSADCYINGYQSKSFSQSPVFADDIETEERDESVLTEQTSQTQVLSSKSDEQSLQSQNEASPSQVQASVSEESTLESSKGMTLEELTAKIKRCTRCQLARTRNNVVPGIGVNNPQVMVIGEGPGYDEDMKGEPFVGKAGLLLDKMLNAIKLDRHSNCYIANIVKCRPPQNRDPFPDEQAACISFLEAQIHILKPKMILCMGRIAGQKLLNSQAPIGQLHGKLFEYNKIPMMITYHPSALLRNEELKRPAWEDLKLFRKKLDELI